MKHYLRCHPFWLATALSGIIAGITLAIMLYAYEQTHHWQYLIFAVGCGGILLSHGAAWWVGYSSKRYHVGIRLVAAAHIISAISTPFLTKDAWVLGLFQLFLVPLEISIADNVKNIPFFVVISMISTAMLFLVDLFNPSLQPLLLVNHHAISTLITATFTFHLVALMFLAWFARFRTGALHYMPIDLGTQQSLVFATISALAIMLVTGVLISRIRVSQEEQIGHNYQTIAQITAERVRNTLEQQIDGLYALVYREDVLQEGLKTANAAYPTTSQEVDYILGQRERQWQKALESSNFVLLHRSNPQVETLNRFRSNNQQQTNLLLLDRYGGLIAAQGAKPAHYYVGDQAWWQEVWNNGLGGVYVGSLSFKEDSNVATVFIAIGVVDSRSNQFMGVLASTYELRSIQGMMRTASSRIDGEMSLVSQDGMVIGSTHEPLVNQTTWLPLMQSLISGNTIRPPGWFLGTNRSNESAVIAYAPIRILDNSMLDYLHNLQWYIVVSNTQSRAFESVDRSTRVAGLTGLLVMVLLVMVANTMSRLITRPIEDLTNTAIAISSGDLDQRAHLVGPIELITLAETFNTLTDRLRTLINNLQDQVTQRTIQLESRVKELQTLNIQFQHELDLARDIQQSLLLPQHAITNNGLEIVCFSKAARDVGGDFYSYHVFDHERFVAGVGDVSGKGVSAALLMATSLSLYDSLAATQLPPATLLSELDRTLQPYTRSRRHNCALCTIEITDNSLIAANAGCIPPYIRRIHGGVEMLDIGGLALGQTLVAVAHYTAAHVVLTPGDTVILTSDGIVEAMNQHGEMFGFERLESTIAQGDVANANTMLTHIQHEVLAFVGNNEPHDDMTIVIIKYHTVCSLDKQTV